MNEDATGPEGRGPMTGRGQGPCGSGSRRGTRRSGRGLRFRSPNPPYRGDINNDDLKETVRDVIKELAKEQKVTD